MKEDGTIPGWSMALGEDAPARMDTDSARTPAAQSTLEFGLHSNRTASNETGTTTTFGGGGRPSRNNRNQHPKYTLASFASSPISTANTDHKATRSAGGPIKTPTPTPKSAVRARTAAEGPRGAAAGVSAAPLQTRTEKEVGEATTHSLAPWIELQCFCGSCFPTAAELSAHVAGCTSGGRACKGCKKEFQDPQSLNIHKLLCAHLAYRSGNVDNRSFLMHNMHCPVDECTTLTSYSDGLNNRCCKKHTLDVKQCPVVSNGRAQCQNPTTYKGVCKAHFQCIGCGEYLDALKKIQQFEHVQQCAGLRAKAAVGQFEHVQQCADLRAKAAVVNSTKKEKKQTQKQIQKQKKVKIKQTPKRPKMDDTHTFGAATACPDCPYDGERQSKGTHPNGMAKYNWCCYTCSKERQNPYTSNWQPQTLDARKKGARKKASVTSSIGNITTTSNINVIGNLQMLFNKQASSRSSSSSSNSFRSSNSFSSTAGGLLDGSALETSIFAFTCVCSKAFAKAGPFNYHKQRCKESMALKVKKEDQQVHEDNSMEVHNASRPSLHARPERSLPLTIPTSIFNKSLAILSEFKEECDMPEGLIGHLKADMEDIFAGVEIQQVEAMRREEEARQEHARQQRQQNELCRQLKQKEEFELLLLQRQNRQSDEGMMLVDDAVDLFDSGSALHSNDISNDNFIVDENTGEIACRYHVTMADQTPLDVAAVYNVDVNAILALSSKMHPTLCKNSPMRYKSALYLPLSTEQQQQQLKLKHQKLLKQQQRQQPQQQHQQRGSLFAGSGGDVASLSSRGVGHYGGGRGRGGAATPKRVKQEAMAAVFAPMLPPLQHPPHSPATVLMTDEEDDDSRPPSPHATFGSNFDCTSPIPMLTCAEKLAMASNQATPDTMITTPSLPTQTPTPTTPTPTPTPTSSSSSAYLTPMTVRATTTTVGLKQKLFKSPAVSADADSSSVKPSSKSVTYTSENGKKATSIISIGYALVPIGAKVVPTSFSGCCARSKSRAEHLKCADCNKCRRGCCTCKVGELDAPVALAWTFDQQRKKGRAQPL